MILIQISSQSPNSNSMHLTNIMKKNSPGGGEGDHDSSNYYSFCRGNWSILVIDSRLGPHLSCVKSYIGQIIAVGPSILSVSVSTATGR